MTIFKYRSGYFLIFLKFSVILFAVWNFCYIINFFSNENIPGNELEKVNKLKQDQNVNKATKSSNKIILPESGIELEDGLTEEVQRFIKELNLTNPGANGKAVDWNDSLITQEHNRLIEKGWEEYGVNVFVSDLIGANRIVADNRSDYCKHKVYSKDLPKVSMILTFYNESWSILIRMLHSILINTPWHLIEEIIMVDDFSDKNHLLKPLDDYVKKLKKVKIIRTHKRLGVSAGRVLGFRNAKGPIIVSLDGHIEVAPGWLEPMLERMKDNPKLATYSSIKELHINSFQLKYDNVRNLTAFKLKHFQFTYPDIKTYQPEINVWEPHRSPILIGSLFAFWKDFGEKIEYIDVELDIYGGDDLEFSFKYWLCGGSIELIPCSVIFHMDKQHRYREDTKGGNTFNYNRIVESWLNDEFKTYYYKVMKESAGKPFGNISKNLKLKEKLKCHDFEWYVKNIFTDIYKTIRDEIKGEN